MQEKQDTTEQLEANSIEVSSLARVSNSEETSDESEQFEDIKNQFLTIFSELPAIISGFLGQYQKQILTLSLIIAGIITFKIMLAILQSLNGIPLVAPTFELIGIIYAFWFISRYILRASNRQELSAEIQAWKDQILGNNPSDS
ncbi:MAG: CAAD domain-containing protein [Trichodesmium sp. MAG_R04]|nr:CAAD domain-containing protein [Trichodesmium sp. MAG_R04]